MALPHPNTSSTIGSHPVTPQETAVSGEFAGLRLVECLSRQPGGEMWRAVTSDSRGRFVRFLLGPGSEAADGGPLARLANIEHECLAPLEIVREGPNRVGLVYEVGDDNLAVRLKECLQVGTPGVPRAELLEQLADVATALDVLRDRHQLHHLTLSPRTVALVDGKARLLDFGLAELFWLPAGQQAGALNPRYAAPELFGGPISRNSDQYSLALIFQEMLTGVHAFRNLNARQMANARQRGNLDLDMLPAPDRPPLLRALDPDPEKRFASCSELIAALSAATVKPKAARPTFVPGAPPPQAPVAVATSGQTVNELVALASEGCPEHERRGLLFLLTAHGSILHYCCARLIPSMVPLKLAGFREQWKGQLIERDEDRFLYHVPLSGSLWRRALGIVPSLGVEIRCEFPTGEGSNLTEAAVEVWPLDCSGSRAGEVIEEHGIRVLESVRLFLNANPERRTQVRVPFEQTLEVVPIIDGERGETLVARARDVSPRGMNVVMACRPPTPQLWVKVKLPSRPEPVPLLTRVVRVRGHEGRYEIGLVFA